MLPDTGERYLSTPLFDGIAVDMNEEEQALSRSTPGYRFDPPAQPVAIVAARPPEVAASLDEKASTLVSKAIEDHAVVMFALEWCEFCWAVRKLFARLGIAFESVDIDSVALQQQDMGTKVRAVLKQRTGAPTIPQIWIGGTHLGGAMDLFDAMRTGRLQRLLSDAGIRYDRDADIDPDQFLPKWLHPRKAA
jgi:cysteine synthase